MDKVLIVEPHGDDSLISCFNILNSVKLQKDVLTLSERSSEALSDYLPNVNARFLSREDYNYSNRPATYKEINQWHKQGLNTFDEYKQLLLDRPEFVSVIQDVYDTLDLLSSEILRQDYSMVLIPRGIVHPYHLAVRLACVRTTQMIVGPKMIYYSEGPYNGKKYGQLLEKDSLESSPELHSLIVPIYNDNIPIKEKIFRKVYPTETTLFRFTYDDVIGNREIYYGSEEDLSYLKNNLNPEIGGNLT